MNRGIGFEIGSYQEFKIKLNEIESELNSISKKTIEFVESQRGASEKIIENQKVKNLLN